ncbi:MAG: 50S ribosomal protein L10 [Deltaproteobacteria bacterium RIFOXYA12_FULL_58_15]|nr:MAG: 50S ribosomal protein L10 [Deltaproteobacteria bacterium RIFOXYA12_FULL_58_15]OGR08275.1 MAG: 50S ribosomal protein L10 [Deltaproteobacteria bacterium RIFOXYB12_FULL_58_9]
MFRTQKTELVDQLKNDLGRAQTVLFLDFTGMTVEEANSLRCKLRESQVGYRVVKNTLVQRAMTGTSFEGAGACLKGTPTGVVLGFVDPVAPAKLTFEFLKDCKHIRVKGGVFDQKPISPAEAESLSKMPSREELQARVVGMVLGVAGGLIGQIKSPAGRIVGALETKADAAA